MRGFTLTELIVVVAVVTMVSTFGARYYFTNTELYCFENVLSEFKSSINLARVRSLSGMVSMGGEVGDTPAAIFINKIKYQILLALFLPLLPSTISQLDPYLAILPSWDFSPRISRNSEIRTCFPGTSTLLRVK